MIVHAFFKIHKAKYSYIHFIASIAAGLNKYHTNFGIRLVDAVVQEIQLCLEDNDYRHIQRLVGLVKYLGELYNHQLVDSHLIFDMLYSLIGHDDSNYVDPPDDLTKVRLVVTLVDTVGQYFTKGAAKLKMKRFILHFRKYIKTKTHLTTDLEFSLADTFESLGYEFDNSTPFSEIESEIQKLGEPSHYYGFKKTIQRIIHRNLTGDGSSDEDRDDEDISDSDDESDDENIPEGSIVSPDTDEVRLSHARPKPVDKEEEDELEREFNKLVQDSLESRRSDSRSNVTVSIPRNVLESGSALGFRSSDNIQNGEDGSLKFRLVMKKGNKPQTKDLNIPQDHRYAVATLAREEEKRKEQERVKYMTMNYSQRADDRTPSANDLSMEKIGKFNVKPKQPSVHDQIYPSWGVRPNSKS